LSRMDLFGKLVTHTPSILAASRSRHWSEFMS